MPFHFDFDPAYKLLRGRFDGLVDDESIKEYYRLAGEHAARLQPRGGITDFSAATSFEVSPETIRRLAHLTPAMADPSRPRVVVAPSQLIYGMARMFQTVGGDTRPRLHVVSTLEEAYALLQVQAPRFEPLEPPAPEGPAPGMQR